MVRNPAFALDQVRHPRRCPQAAFVPQSFRPALQTALDTPQVFRAQARFASRPSRSLQSSQSTSLQLLRPAADRLPMHPHPASDFRWVNALAQQFGRLTTALL
jgi:hypothetical protein